MRFLLWLFVLANIIFSFSAFAGDEIPKKFYGPYLCILPRIVADGSFFKDYFVRFKVGGKGVFWYAPAGEVSRGVLVTKQGIVDLKKSDALSRLFPDAPISTVFAIKKNPSPTSLERLIIDFSESTNLDTDYHASIFSEDTVPEKIGLCINTQGLWDTDMEILMKTMFDIFVTQKVSL